MIGKINSGAAAVIHAFSQFSPTNPTEPRISLPPSDRGIKEKDVGRAIVTSPTKKWRTSWTKTPEKSNAFTGDQRRRSNKNSEARASEGAT